jgi:hypothetical protein
MGIKVSIEENEIENQYLGYDINNSASVLLDIKDDNDVPLEVGDETGMWICTIIIIVIILLIILIIYFLTQKRKASGFPPDFDESMKDFIKERENKLDKLNHGKKTNTPNKVGQPRARSKLIQSKLRTKEQTGQEQRKNVHNKSKTRSSDNLEKIREQIKNDRRSGPRINW